MDQISTHYKIPWYDGFHADKNWSIVFLIPFAFLSLVQSAFLFGKLENNYSDWSRITATALSFCHCILATRLALRKTSQTPVYVDKDSCLSESIQIVPLQHIPIQQVSKDAKQLHARMDFYFIFDLWVETVSWVLISGRVNSWSLLVMVLSMICRCGYEYNSSLAHSKIYLEHLVQDDFAPHRLQLYLKRLQREVKILVSQLLLLLGFSVVVQFALPDRLVDDRIDGRSTYDFGWGQIRRSFWVVQWIVFLGIRWYGHVFQYTPLAMRCAYSVWVSSPYQHPKKSYQVRSNEFIARWLPSFSKDGGLRPGTWWKPTRATTVPYLASIRYTYTAGIALLLWVVLTWAIDWISYESSASTFDMDAYTNLVLPISSLGIGGLFAIVLVAAGRTASSFALLANSAYWMLFAFGWFVLPLKQHRYNAPIEWAAFSLNGCALPLLWGVLIYRSISAVHGQSGRDDRWRVSFAAKYYIDLLAKRWT